MILFHALWEWTTQFHVQILSLQRRFLGLPTLISRKLKMTCSLLNATHGKSIAYSCRQQNSSPDFSHKGAFNEQNGVQMEGWAAVWNAVDIDDAEISPWITEHKQQSTLVWFCLLCWKIAVKTLNTWFLQRVFLDESQHSGQMNIQLWCLFCGKHQSSKGLVVAHIICHCFLAQRNLIFQSFVGNNAITSHASQERTTVPDSFVESQQRLPFGKHGQSHGSCCGSDIWIFECGCPLVGWQMLGVLDFECLCHSSAWTERSLLVWVWQFVWLVF